MKKHLLFVLLTMFAVSAAAQQKVHKTFTGDYYMKSSGIMGKTTYSYYEKEDGEWIKDGKFTLKVDIQLINRVGTKSSLVTVINGNYKDGLMDGAWSWDVSAVDIPDNSDICTTATKKMTGNFSQGLAHGAWTFNAPVQKKRKILVKSYLPTTYKFGEYYTADEASGSCRLTFDKGLIIGAVQSDYMGSASGSYKAANCPDGHWVCRAINGIETDATFENGWLTKLLRRRSGQVIARTEWDDDVKEMTFKVARGEVDTANMDGYVVKLFPMNTIFDVDLALYDASFYRKDLEGDNTPDYGGMYGKYKQILKIKYEDWDVISTNELPYIAKEPYHERIGLYTDKYLNSMYISPKNKEEVRALIAECEREIELYPQKKELQKSYADSVKRCQAKDYSPGQSSYSYIIEKEFKNEDAKNTSILLQKYIGQKFSELRINRFDENKLNDDLLNHISLDSVKVLYNADMTDLHEAVAKGESCLAVKSAYEEFVNYVKTYTDVRASSSPYAPATVTEKGILPYVYIAFGYMNKHDATEEDYIDIIRTVVKINGSDGKVKKSFKAVSKSPTAIIELINSYK